ncbi:MAG: hypothetical protein FWB91_09620 [Defluviitaleaceae bacterium]|nr:hypothetical protein [Defluviitaleaceae bacterium]
MTMTSLYVELIIIGIQTSIWMVLIVANIIGVDALAGFLPLVSSVPFFTLLLGLFYIIGMVFDRFADWVYINFENRIRHKYGFAGKMTSLIWQKIQLNDFIKYQRTRIRIIRATSLNIMPITVSLAALILQFSCERLFLLAFTVFVGLGVFFIAFFSHRTLIEKYYDKARIIEQSEKQQGTVNMQAE